MPVVILYILVVIQSMTKFMLYILVDIAVLTINTVNNYITTKYDNHYDKNISINIDKYYITTKTTKIYIYRA